VKFITAAMLLATALAQPQSPQTLPFDGFHYDRNILIPQQSPENSSPNACVLLDADIFAHSAATLSDLRLFSPDGHTQIPYAVTLSSTDSLGDTAAILNPTLKSPNQLSFDLQMPRRPYSAVDLTLHAQDFIASAHVTGINSRTDSHPVFLGDYTLYDLTAQHLGNDTRIPIAESTFPYLHIALTLRPTTGNTNFTSATVVSAQIPPARQAQTLYTGVAESFNITQRPKQTVAVFNVAAHVPIERVTFTVDPSDRTNFSRIVTISAKPSGSTNGEVTPAETLSGQISRVHLDEAGEHIDQQSLSIPAILASNSESAATVQVILQNGDDPPLKVRSIRLEMRQRKLCFPAGTHTLTLAYGSAIAQVPTYDFAKTFNASAPVRHATLSHEHTNALFIASPKQSRFERYPAFVGLSILVAVCLLAVIAYRALHRGHHDSLRR
jgi:hypothetical protein